MKPPPGDRESLNSLGNERRAAGDLAGAIDCYRRSLEIEPGLAAARYNLGLVLLDLDRTDEAEEQFRRLREINPRDAEVLLHLALILDARSRFAEAEQMYREALDVTPGNPVLWYGLALACRRQPGRMEESVRSLRRCLELDAEFADAHRTLADTLQGEGRLDEAIGHYRAAIRIAPGGAAARSQLGNALLKAGRLDEAIRSYREAIEVEPGFAHTHLNLGAALVLTRAYDQALDAYQTALRLEPGSAAARGCVLAEKQRICQWDGLDELCELQRRSAASQPEHEILPFSLLSIPSTPEEQLQCARNYAGYRARAVARERERPGFTHDRAKKKRLTIGYLSADYREHPVASLIAELFELHDRGGFEILGYSIGPDDRSPMRARLARAFDRFTDITALPHADAAARIHQDRVDILVNLTGHTSYARTEIAALRPAPVQVNYLGYPGTLGADFIDYIITDRFLTPPGSERHLSETPVYMPATYQANDRKRAVAETPPRSALGLPAGAFVFACFNHTYKILPGVFAAWMRTLQAVPGSVLWLLKSNPWAEENLRQEAAGRGVNPARLLFAPPCPQDRHLGRMRAADLFLDTQPYNAHTTASDALWAGLPVVTCAGNTFASRVAGSLLTAVGMPELVTNSMEAYEALALRLARNPAELAALREKLARNRDSTPLFDTPAFTRHLEAAYLRMWESHLAGSGSRAIDLREQPR